MTTSIKSLRQAAKYGMLLEVHCRQCSHTGRFLASDVAKFVNPSKALERLPFRCSECATNDCETTAIEIDRDRKPKVLVWRPMLLK